MTPQEANIYASQHIDKINFEDDTITITVSNEWLEVVGEALEKQIPKKPNDKYTSDKTYHTYTCSVCGWEFFGEFSNYCCVCGTKFDWSDTE